jgi:acyl-coenzyme A synthetase/AMP-(fatty) acid ligase
LAVAKLGGVFIPSSTQFRAGEIQYRLQDSAAVATIVTAELLPAVEEAASAPSLNYSTTT